MWVVLCNFVVEQHEEEYRHYCLDHTIHYCPDILRWMLYHMPRVSGYADFIHNIFLRPEVKKYLHLLYVICMRYKSRLRRILIRHVYRRKQSCNMVDLSYTPFSEYTPSSCLSLIDRGKKYMFTHQELHNLIQMPLNNSDSYMIANPLPIKNPYTGIAFSNEMLYFLYLNLKFIPLCFRHFIEVEFNVGRFLLEWEPSLRQYQIHKRIREMKLPQLRREMADMMVEMCGMLSFHESSVFVITQQENECRELLTHYYNYMYSLSSYQRQCECATLLKKIKIMAVKPP